MNLHMSGVQSTKIALLYVLVGENIMMQILKDVLIVKSNIVLFVMVLESNAMDVKMDIIQWNWKMEILSAKKLQLNQNRHNF